MGWMEPTSQLTPEEYTALKDLWRVDDELIHYPFPAIAFCRHEIMWNDDICPYIQFRLTQLGFDLTHLNEEINNG